MGWLRIVTRALAPKRAPSATLIQCASASGISPMFSQNTRKTSELPSRSAWIVFSRPSDNDMQNPMSPHVGSHAYTGSITECLQTISTASTYTHTTLLLEDSQAFSVSLSRNVQEAATWDAEKIEQSRWVDSTTSKLTYKLYYHLPLTNTEYAVLERVAREKLAFTQYPTMAYYTTALFGWVVSMETIIKWMANDRHHTCSTYVFEVLLESGVLKTDADINTAKCDLVLPDALHSLDIVQTSPQHDVNQVATRIRSHTRAARVIVR